MGTNVVTPLPICPIVSGTGYVAADMKKSQHLYMMYYDNKPTWAASDLELSPGIDLKLPQLTTL
jgi:hypothetical protein